MRRFCSPAGLSRRLPGLLLCAAGLLLLVIFVPYQFWAAILGLVLVGAGVMLLLC